MKTVRIFTPGLQRVLVISAAVLTVAGCVALRATEPPRPLYLDPTQPVERRVEDLLPRLTLEDKVALLHGNSLFTTAGVARLGIPVRWLSDGPHGVRQDIRSDAREPAGRTDDFATCMPCGLALAATWNPEVAYAEWARSSVRRRGRATSTSCLGPE